MYCQYWLTPTMISPVASSSGMKTPDERAEHRAAPAEQAGAADHDRGDDHQVVQRVARDRGVLKYPRFRIPARPAISPLSAYTLIRCRSTLMPARTAASGFDPIA